MDDLTSRITAALDRAERSARQAMISGEGEPTEALAGRRVRIWKPEAVLDLIDAHREILALAQAAIDRPTHPKVIPAREVLALVAKAHRIEVPDADQ